MLKDEVNNSECLTKDGYNIIDSLKIRLVEKEDMEKRDNLEECIDKIFRKDNLEEDNLEEDTTDAIEADAIEAIHNDYKYTTSPPVLN